jgi:hypothetical protein
MSQQLALTRNIISVCNTAFVVWAGTTEDTSAVHELLCKWLRGSCYGTLLLPHACTIHMLHYLHSNFIEVDLRSPAFVDIDRLCHTLFKLLRWVAAMSSTLQQLALSNWYHVVWSSSLTSNVCIMWLGVATVLRSTVAHMLRVFIACCCVCETVGNGAGSKL